MKQLLPPSLMVLAPRPNTLRACVVLAGFILFSATSLAQAPPCGGDVVSRCWTGAVNGNWSNPNNWTPVGVPQNGELLRFNNDNHTTMVNDIVGLSLKAIWLFDYDYTLSGNPLTLSGIGGTQSYQSGINMIGGDSHNVTISCPLILGSDVAFAAGCSPDLINDTIALYLNADINLNGHTLRLTATKSGGRIQVSGSISGDGDIIIGDFDICDPGGSLEFSGTAANTFTGALKIFRSPSGSPSVSFNKQTGPVVTNRLELHEGFVLTLGRDGQIGDNAAVVLNDGSQLRLNGRSETIRSLVMTNLSSDASACLVNTEAGGVPGSGLLSLRSSLTSWVLNDSVLPTIKGVLSLPLGDHPFNIATPGAYAGFDMQAQIAGQGGFTKSGNAGLLLKGSNSYSGPVVVRDGFVDARHVRAFGAGANGVQLDGGGMILRNLSIGTETLTVTRAGSSIEADGNCTWSGSITLNQQLTIYSDQTFYLPGVIIGTGGLSLFGNNIELSGSLPNTFTGPTRVNCNSLVLNKAPTGTTYAFSGPLIIGEGVATACQAGWLNDFQINRTTTTVTLHPTGVMNLNGRNDTIGSLVFNGGIVQNSGLGTLSLFESVTANAADTTASITGGRLALAAGSRTFTVEDGPLEPELVISETILDFGGIAKNGLGTLRLSGANTFLGSVNINAGMIHIQSDTALGSTAGRTTVADGATLQVEFVAALNEPLTLSGAGRGGTLGALNLLAATGVQADIALAGASAVRVDSQFSTLSGVVSGTGSLTKLGAGNLSLGGSSGTANTYAGDTIVDEGILFLFKPASVQAVPGNLIVGRANGGTTAIARHFNPHQIGGGITVNRGGLLDLFGFDEYAGDVALNGGGDIQTGAGILYLAGDGVNLTVTPINTGQSVISGRLGLFPGAHRFSIGGRVAGLAGAEIDIPADIIESGPSAAITKEGAGQLLLRGNNSFGGLLTINGGTVTASNNYALGTLTGGTIVNNNASLQLDGGRVIINEALTLNSSNALAFTARNGSNYWAGPITLNRDSAINVPLANAILHVPTTVSGPGGLVKLGPGILQFWGTPANTYAGLTTVAEGTIEARRTGQISIPGDAVIGTDATNITTARLLIQREQQFPGTANVAIRRSGLLHLFPLTATPLPTPTLRSITGVGQLQMINVGSVLTISNEHVFEFGGTISGNGSLIKTGSGTMRVTGGGFFNGATAVNAGTYWLDGELSGSPVTVGLNAILRGDGFAGNVTTAGLDSKLIVDSKIPARLGGDFETMNLSLASGSVVAFDFSGPSANGGNDSLIAHGSVALNNAGLGYTFNYAPREGDMLTVLRKDSAGAISGVFGGWPEGITRTIGGVTVRATYFGGNGNDFTLTVTNTAAGNAGYRLAEGNGNQTVEPNECNLLYLSLANRRVTSLTITSAVLRAVLPGALITVASATYPVIAAGATRENLTPFQFRTDPAMACGTPVEFELVVGVAGEGIFAVTFNPVSGNDCAHPTGGCESCFAVSGQFTANTPALLRSLNFIGGPSLCFPTKPCPQTNFFSDTVAVPYLTHCFTNSTTNELCLTAQLRFGCPGALTNTLGAAAYLGTNIVDNPCGNYLGDTGADGAQPFSFRVPAKTNFVILVSARETNAACPNYTLELFGLPCPPPTLHIVKDAAPNKILLQWSTASPGFALQTTNALRASGPSGFSNVTTSPVIAGSKYTVTNSTTQPRQFFRLAR